MHRRAGYGEEKQKHCRAAKTPRAQRHGDSPQRVNSQNQQTRHGGHAIALRNEDRHEREHVQEQRRGHPAGNGILPREQHAREAHSRHRAKEEARQQNPLQAQERDDREVIVLERIPKRGHFPAEQRQPRAGVRADLQPRFFRPVSRNLLAGQRAASRFFGKRDGIVEKLLLARAKARRDFRITIRLRMIADPEIDPAMRREEGWLARHEAVVHPGRSGPNPDSQAEQRGPRQPAPPRDRPQEIRRKRQRHDEKNRRHQHRHRADRHAHRAPRPNRRATAQPQGPPSASPVRRDEPRGRHQDHRKSLCRDIANPSQRREGAGRDAPARLPLCFDDAPRQDENHQRRPRLQHALQADHRKRLHSTERVNAGEQKSISRQPVKRMMVRPLSAQDAQRPIVVKLRVAALHPKVWRLRKLPQHP